MYWGILIALVVAGLAFVVLKKKIKSNRGLPEKFVIFDLETTGLQANKHEIIEFGAIRVNGDIQEPFEAFVRPLRKIPKHITELTGISQEMVDLEGGMLHEVLSDFLDFVGDYPLVAYNAEFDISFINHALRKTNLNHPLKNKVICALQMARRAWPDRKSYKLVDLARDHNLSEEGTHRALGDCTRTLAIYLMASEILK